MGHLYLVQVDVCICDHVTIDVGNLRREYGLIVYELSFQHHFDGRDHHGHLTKHS